MAEPAAPVPSATATDSPAYARLSFDDAGVNVDLDGTSFVLGNGDEGLDYQLEACSSM